MIFYADIVVGAGYDVMLKQYENAHCAGSTGLVGANGWYASGQVFAYVGADVGLEVHLWFFSAKFSVVKFAAAAVLQAQLPNPSWMRGIVAGQFSVLGGLVSGDCRFKFELGTHCDLISDDPDNSKVLTDVTVVNYISPDQGSEQVSLLAPVKATFFIPLDESVNFVNDNGDKEYFKFYLKRMTLTKNTGEVIAGAYKIANDNRSVEFLPESVLPAKETLKVQVVVGAKKLQGSNYTDVVINGKIAEEIKTISFQTINEPLKDISQDNIEMSYPLYNQMNLYKDEFSKSFIKLKRRQDELFTANTYVAKLISYVDNSEITLPDIQYASGNITYTLPATIAPNTGYKFLLYNKDVSGSEVKLYTYDFRASFYKTLKEKMEDVPKITSEFYEADFMNNKKEPFDLYELEGKDGNTPLIELEAKESDWYTGLYKWRYNTSFDDYLIGDRKYDDYGSPPIKAVWITQMGVKEWANGISLTLSVKGQPKLAYHLSDYIYMDVARAMSICNQNFDGMPVIQYKALFTFNTLSAGDYPVQYKYVLPNGTEGISSGNSINFNYTGDSYQTEPDPNLRYE